MTQIAYHPAFDPYSSLLRIIRVFMATSSQMDSIKARIGEFFILFPERLIEARLSPQLRARAKRITVGPRYPYDRLPSSRILFDRMQPSFEAALQTMQVRGFVTSAPDGTMSLNQEVLPVEITSLALEQNGNEAYLADTLGDVLSAYPTGGPDGLKARSKLMEFRYDVA